MHAPAACGALSFGRGLRMLHAGLFDLSVVVEVAHKRELILALAKLYSLHIHLFRLRLSYLPPFESCLPRPFLVPLTSQSSPRHPRRLVAIASSLLMLVSEFPLSSLEPCPSVQLGARRVWVPWTKIRASSCWTPFTRLVVTSLIPLVTSWWRSASEN